MLGFLTRRPTVANHETCRLSEEIAAERRLSSKRLRMIADLRAEVERLSASNVVLARVAQDHRSCFPRTDPVSFAGRRD
jgi:hypothetical protein